MEKNGLIFQHFAYVISKQLTFKQAYYGYRDALAEWQRLQSSNLRPLKLRNFLSWVKDGAMADSAKAQSICPIAYFDTGTCSWRFLPQSQIELHSVNTTKVRLGILFEHLRFRLVQFRRRLLNSLKAFTTVCSKAFFRYVSLWHVKSLLTIMMIDIIGMSFIRRKSTNSVIVVKVDRLGDYVICRKFLRLIRTHSRYQSRKIYLCADVNLKDLIEAYDGDAFDGFIWIDPVKLMNEPVYRFGVLQQIKQLGADTAIHPTYAREIYIGDCLIFASRASERIGRESYVAVESAVRDLRSFDADIGDIFYNHIEPEQRDVIFEFYRYRSFFSRILPGLDMPKDTRFTPLQVPVPEIGDTFAVIMPGANQAFRQWPPECFAQVARHLYSTYGMRIVILGNHSDKSKAAVMRKAAPEIPMENLCGELSLPQIVWLVSRCTIGLTNDSGGLHLLAALDKLGVAVVNGNRFGWFYPYPKEFLPSISFVYPPGFLAEELTWDQRTEAYREDGKYHRICDISPDAVVERIAAILQGSTLHNPMPE
jgi:ADP-heptose:LPS heptosyltransferase